MKMKQIKFAGAAMAAALMLLTSCLGETGNSGQVPDLPGRAYYSKGKMLIETEWGVLYPNQSSASLLYDEGDWMYVSFAYDWDSPENVNWEANGYVSVTLLTAPTAIPKGIVTPSTDTTQVMTNEIALTKGAYNPNHYQFRSIKQRELMFTSDYSGMTDQKTEFMLYYDFNSEPYVSNDFNTYTLYVRAIKTDEGKSPKINYHMPNSYNTKMILDLIYAREKAAGKTAFNLAFRYVSEIDEETHELTWESDTEMAFVDLAWLGE
jgi:hypothetical protein